MLCLHGGRYQARRGFVFLDLDSRFPNGGKLDSARFVSTAIYDQVAAKVDILGQTGLGAVWR